jgi:hypothetical protein
MTAGPEADRADTGQEGAAALRPSWFLLPVAWCVWLLVFLAPSLLAGPHLQPPRPWLTADTAPTAVVAAAAFFLVAIWPFWPALAGAPAPAGRMTARRLGRTLLEGAILVALAAPFVLVAWSVADRAMELGPALAVAAGLLLLGVLLRTAAVAAGPAGVRWLVLATWLLAAGPLIVLYGAGETVGWDASALLPVSPVVAAVRLAVDGWSDAFWPEALAAVLVVVGACHLLGLLRRRAVCG